MSHDSHDKSPDLKKLKFDAILGIVVPFIAVLVIATIILLCNQ